MVIYGAKPENLTTPPWHSTKLWGKDYGAKIRVRFSHIWPFLS